MGRTIIGSSTVINVNNPFGGSTGNCIGGDTMAGEDINQFSKIERDGINFVVGRSEEDGKLVVKIDSDNLRLWIEGDLIYDGT
jgi:hypothetical protein